MHSSRIRIDRLLTVCLLVGDACRGCIHLGVHPGGWVHLGGCIQGGCSLDAPPPPCEQNDTCL